MNPITLTGIIGSLILVTGAAWPVKKNIPHAVKSTKNWLFAVGNLLMFLFALLGFLEGGPIFYVFLETLILVSTVLMLIDAPDKVDIPILTLSGAILIIWSLTLFEDHTTVIFVLGLTSASLGFALQMGTVRRSLALTLGSVLIATFSYIEQSWIFFWLNVFFALFSGYYVYKGLLASPKT